MNILDYFPAGLTPRPQQRDILLRVEAEWSSTDVFVLTCPTATGKTEIAKCISDWQAAQQRKTTILEPTNLLVDQFRNRYPDICVMSSQEQYYCKDFERPCVTSKQRLKKFCSGCPYIAAKLAMPKASSRLMNYHTYYAHRAYSSTLIVDEAHQLIDMLNGMREIRLWSSQFKFPARLMTVADVLEWGQDYLRRVPGAKLRGILSDLAKVQGGAWVVYDRMFYRGEKQDVLRVVPAPGVAPPDYMWPTSKVRKIVLMSATIDEHDVRELGLAWRRVLYIECDSPIPTSNRPVIYTPLYNLGFSAEAPALAKLAGKLRHELDNRSGKGLIHLPYRAASQLMEILDHPRLIWHEAHNKQDALDRFRGSPLDDGRVLVASGMYEGVDLPYDAARWQVIGKVPYLSLGDPVVKARADHEPDWYAWQTIKRMVQAAGRIVRAPDDYGETLVFDMQFGRLLDADSRRKRSLFPRHFRDSIRFLSR